MEYKPFTLPLFASALISLGLVAYVWRQYRRGNVVRGARMFALMMISIAGWATSHSLQLMSVALEGKIFWTHITYIFIVSAPVLLLAFSAQYCGNERFVTPRNLLLASIIPIIVLLGVFLNPYKVFWVEFSLGTQDLVVKQGPLFTVHAAYSYLLIVVSLFQLLRTIFESTYQYRWQIGLLTIGILAPVLLNVFYLASTALGSGNFESQQDMTPIGFAITGLFLAWDLYRFGFLDIAPIARNTVVETMGDAMLVLNGQNRIIDLNLAAKNIIGLDSQAVVGKYASHSLSAWSDVLDRYRTVNSAQDEISLQVGSERRDFDLHITPLSDRKGKLTGRLILLHDITERKRIEMELQQAKALAEAEREKSESLLLNILPQDIATLLKRGDQIIAEHFDSTSILFADVVDFTSLSLTLGPVEIVGLLNEIFSHFDTMVDNYGLEKIKTIGDCYMVAAGVPSPRTDHAQALANLALDIQDYMSTHRFMGRSLQFRIGINSGPVVAGVIGRKKFIYDLWGDTVNTASRMEAHGSAGCIQVTEDTFQLLDHDFQCEPRGMVNVKGKGSMPVWHVMSRRA